jgi:hypothetical protein
MENEGMELEEQRLSVAQWMWVTLKLRMGNHAKHGKLRKTGKVKVRREKQQDMKDIPLSLPLLP